MNDCVCRFVQKMQLEKTVHLHRKLRRRHNFYKCRRRHPNNKPSLCTSPRCQTTYKLRRYRPIMDMVSRHTTIDLYRLRTILHHYCRWPQCPKWYNIHSKECKVLFKLHNICLNRQRFYQWETRNRNLSIK